MKKQRKITLYREGKKETSTIYIKYINSENKRKHLSLKLSDMQDAIIIRSEILLLQNDPEANVSQKAYKLYFGKEKEFIGDFLLGPEANDRTIYIQELKKQISTLKLEVKMLIPFKDKCKFYEKQFEMLGKNEEFPTFTETKEAYQKVLDKLQTDKDHQTFLRGLFEFCGDKKINQYTPELLENYLEDSSEQSKCKPKAFNKRRKIMSKYFRWAAKKYKMRNPVEDILTQKEPKNQIKWFSETEVLAFCDKIKNEYWRNFMLILFYTGLNRAELMGIKKSDIIKLNYKTVNGIKHGEFISVNWNEHRRLKTTNRKRTIPISDKLKPILEKQLKTKGDLLFTCYLGNHKGGCWNNALGSFHTQRKEHIPAGMLPSDMRRSFASIMVRGGRSVDNVADVLGNTPEVVRENYAHELASEIDTNI